MALAEMSEYRTHQSEMVDVVISFNKRTQSTLKIEKCSPNENVFTRKPCNDKVQHSCLHLEMHKLVWHLFHSHKNWPP